MMRRVEFLLVAIFAAVIWRCGYDVGKIETLARVRARERAAWERFSESLTRRNGGQS